MTSRYIFLLPAALCLAYPAPPAWAQWEPEMRLVVSDSMAMTSPNNARCLAAGPGGSIQVVWWDTRNGFGEIYTKCSSDCGITWAPDTRLTFDPARSLYPTIAVSGPKVHVAWSEDRDGNYEIYYKRSTDEGGTWSPDTRLTYAVNNGWFSSLAAVGDDVHVVWWDYRDRDHEVYYKRSTDGGETWSPDTRLTFAPHDSWYPSISASGATVHAAWWDNRDGNYEIYYKRSTDNGFSWGPDVRLTSDSGWSSTPCIASSGDRVYLAWEDDRNGAGEIYYKFSTDDGATWSPDARLTFDPGWSVMPSIWASGAKVHLVWDDDRDGNEEIYYRCSSDSGLTWSGEERLSYGRYNSTYPSISAIDSMVHVVWTDSRSGNPEIYYARNPTGNSGNEERTEAGGQRLEVRVMAKPDPFVSYATVPGRETEYFEVYDVSGRKVGTYLGDRIGQNIGPGVYFLRPVDKKAAPVRIVKIR